MISTFFPDHGRGLRRCLASSLVLGAATLALMGSAWSTEITPEQQERKEFFEKAKQAALGDPKSHSMVEEMRVAMLRPFGDWDYYVVFGGNIVWTPNFGQKRYAEVSVPPGFVTDLASVPRLFWQVMRPEGRHAYAAVVHDYLYWTQTRPRAEADMIFKLAMEDSKVPRAKIDAVYKIVRSELGQSAWDKNTKLRKAGECRFLKTLPTDYTVSWSDWKKTPDICSAANF